MRCWMLMLALAIGAPAVAQVQGGDGTLSGTGTVKVKPGCGRERFGLTGLWRFEPTGLWTATTSGQPVLTGSKVDATGNGRIWRLAFDAPSQLVFDTALESMAMAACGTPVTLSGPSRVTHFDLKLNKRKTRAKLTLKARATGTSAAGSGTGTYKAIVRGAWNHFLWDTL